MKKVFVFLFICFLTNKLFSQTSFLNDTIRVESSGSYISGALFSTPLYHIAFSKNNWRTKKLINIGKYIEPNFRDTDFPKKEALKIAQSLTSYQACLDFNEKLLFHTKIEEQKNYKSSDDSTIYVIIFTDDNWRSKKYIMNAYIPENGGSAYVEVFYTKDRKEAENLASSNGYGKNLKACQDNNDMQQLLVNRRNTEIKNKRNEAELKEIELQNDKIKSNTQKSNNSQNKFEFIGYRLMQYKRPVPFGDGTFRAYYENLGEKISYGRFELNEVEKIILLKWENGNDWVGKYLKKSISNNHQDIELGTVTETIYYGFWLDENIECELHLLKTENNEFSIELRSGKATDIDKGINAWKKVFRFFIRN
jgi:hypothetical protein